MEEVALSFAIIAACGLLGSAAAIWYEMRNQ
jgi:hypothetical protein